MALSSTCHGMMNSGAPNTTKRGRKMSPVTSWANEMVTTEMPAASVASPNAWRVVRGWSGIPNAYAVTSSSTV